jgi:Ca2+-binding RTX toxin-like protein
MALTNLNTNWTNGSYLDDVASFITKGEGYIKKAYFDNKTPLAGSIAIGIGYDLLQNSPTRIAADFAAAGIAVTKTQLDLIEAAQKATAADKAQKWNDLVNNLGIQLTEPQATSLLKTILPTYENRLTSILTGNTPNIAGDLPLSHERIVLLDMKFNGLLTFQNDSTRRRENTIALINAINQGDRAEAWYLIRYEFRRYGYAKNPGWAMRAFAESAQFGLYDSPTVTAGEGERVFQMYTKHRVQISDYESSFPALINRSVANVVAEANQQYRTTIVNDLLTELITAKDPYLSSLKEKYAGLSSLNPDQVSALDIQVAPDNNVSAKLDASYGNHRSAANVLVGGDYMDSITAGSGDDFLIGGLADDILFGGDGDDLYVFNRGDGDDTIIDSDGSGKIRVGAKELNGAAKESYLDDANGKHQTWESDDGQFKYVMLDGDAEVGGTLQITGEGLGANCSITVKNFKNDQLGIKLNLKKEIAFSSSGGNQNPIDSADYVADQTAAAFNEFGTKAAKLFLNGPAEAGDKLKLSAGGADWLYLVNGAETLSFGDDVELELTEGQTEVAFLLWGKDAIVSDESVTLTASYISGSDSASSASDTMILTIHNLEDVADQEFQTTNTIDGDMEPSLDNTGSQRLDGWGNIIPNGPAPDRADTIYDTFAGDLITAGGGNDAVHKHRSGDDVIKLGDGDDDFYTSLDATGRVKGEGGAGSDYLGGGNDKDVLEGGDGADGLYGAGGDDVLYANTKIAQEDAIANGATEEGTGQRGEWFDAEDGGDQAYGSAGTDLMAGGNGDDLLVGGGGGDWIWGDLNTWAPDTANWRNWTVTERVDTSGDGSTTYSYDLAEIMVSSADGTGNDVIYAGAGDDAAFGEGGDDLLNMEAGNDKAWGGAGSDTILGGGDDDILSGDAGVQLLAESLHGDDFIDGGDGNDKIYGNGGHDTLFGGAGDDEIYGDAKDNTLAGDDYLDGEDGNDKLVGAGGNDVVFGGAGNDLLAGDSSDTPEGLQGDDELYGEDGNDELQGNRGQDYLDGGAGNDTLFGGRGKDQLFGGDGDDTLTGDDGADNAGPGEDDSLDGGTGDDTLFGQAGNDVLTGGDGKDILQAGDGDDTASGGEGDDILHGEAGNDDLSGDAGDDQLSGGEGDDLLNAGGGNDQMGGGDGNDTLDGGDGNDLLFGEDGDDVLLAGAGDDQLSGGEGNDVLDGGDGADLLDGGAGDDVYLNVGADDTVFDEAGENRVEFAEGVGADDINITNVNIDGVQTLVMDIGGHKFLEINSSQSGSVQNNYEFAGGTQLTHDELMGQRFFGEQVLRSTNGDDTLHGYAGDDSLFGQGGNDTLFGHAGDDQLSGSAGDDILTGGQGNDVLLGGHGNDTYLFSRGDGQDVIIDGGLSAGENMIRFASDIASSDVIIERLANGDLLLKIDNGVDQITVQGWYNDPANRIEQIEFGDGYFLTATDLDSLTVAPIEGTDLAEPLSGTAYNDTILGHGSDDTIDGGAGNDRIEGGDGVDTYLLKHGMGEDTIIDASVDGNIIKLYGGLDFADLDANRNGNDLVLHLAGSAEGMVLKDYYVNPQSWVVENDEEEQQDVEQIVTTTEASQQDKIGQMWRDYLAQSRGAAISYFFEQGYQLRADGTLYKPWSDQYNGTQISASVSDTTTTETTTLQWYDGTPTTSTTTVTRDQNWNTNPRDLTDLKISISTNSTRDNESIIYAGDHHTWSRTDEQVILETRWNQHFSWGTADQTNSSSVGWIYGGPYSSEVIGTRTVERTRLFSSNLVKGSITNMLAAGTVDVGTGYYPRYMNATLTTDTDNYYYEEIYASNADNEIYGYRGAPRYGDFGGTLVDAGGGDDTVIGAGFAFGGSGNDVLRDGDVLVGGQGDDILEQGFVLVGGEGDDYMNGGTDDSDTREGTRYLIDPTQFGNDTIEDDGDGFNEGGEAILDVVEFGAGLDPNDVLVRWGPYEGGPRYVFLSWGQGKQIKMEIRELDGLDEETALAGDGIELVKFHDGTTWDVAELESRATIVSTEGNDLIYGSGDADLIQGVGGSDTIYGQQGDDTLDGGAGDDSLFGGEGDDSYIFGVGSGHDSVYDDDLAYNIRISAGLSPSDVIVTRDQSGLHLVVNGGADKLTLVDWFAGASGVLEVAFADGTVWDTDTVESRISYAPSEGADYLEGGSSSDALTGLGGSDVLVGLDGDDVLDGGTDNDVMSGGTGSDVYLFRRGDGVDTIDDYSEGAGTVNSVQFGESISTADIAVGFKDNDLILSITGTADRLVLSNWLAVGGPTIDEVEFEDGTIWSAADLFAKMPNVSTAGDDYLRGGDGDDTLVGLAGNDRLRGGLGDDHLSGGAGNDVYMYSRGDGSDVIENLDSAAGSIDAIRFDATISVADITVTRDWTNLYISVDGTSDRITLLNWFANDANRIDLVEFADGTIWNPARLLSKLSNDPTEGDDFLTGTEGGDQMDGDEGNDYLFGGGGEDGLDGGGGNDYLSGDLGDDYFESGAGNDILLGGAGDDYISDSEGSNALDGGNGNDYLDAQGTAINFITGGRGDDYVDIWAPHSIMAFNMGDGSDEVYLSEPLTLSLGGGISADDLTLIVDDVGGLILNIGAADRIGLIFDTSGIGITLQIVGDDVRSYDFTAVIASFNEAVAQGTLATWSLQDILSANLISMSIDQLIGGELAYRYAHDGNLNGLTPAAIQDLLKDPDFGVTAQLVDIGGADNTAPAVNIPIEDRTFTEDTPFLFQLPVDTFSDPDAGDQLTLHATLDDGSALPAWIHFDADTGTFSGTPDNSAVGNIVIKVTALDQAGATVEASFNFAVNNINDAPVVAQPIAAASATEDEVFSFTIPNGTFLNVDAGDTLSYTATLANGDDLPSWITFDAATGTFSGTPGNGNVGPLSVMVTATDSSGVIASSSFELDVANVNDAPTLIYPIADHAAVEDAVFSFTVPADAFNDIDVGDNLTYSATLANGDPLPSWLTFDPGTRTISGTPGADQVGSLSIRIAATDTSGLSASDTFDLKVATLNRTLTGTSGADILVGGAGNDTITDSNGSDTIDGGDGDDVISDGGSGTNMLRGGDGNDVITFSAVANNMIEGGAGNDLLKMDALNGSSLLYANTFAGGTGNDRMESGGSTDTYLFNRGDGQDVISDDDRLYYQKLDKLVFGEGIATTDVTVTRSGNDLMLKINDPANPGASDEIKIENWDTIWYRIEQVEFVDGTTWSAAQLSEWAMAATDEADTLALWSDGGVVDGKGGNDTINFSSLNTSLAPTTIYGGDGNDSINTYSSGNNSSTFTVDGGAGDDTITDVGEMGIRRTLLGGDGNDVITFSCLGYSGNYAINGGAGNDWIKADGYLTSTGTYRWVNTLTGGAGDDRIESGRSADTYLFNRGDGQDVIRDYNNSSFDTVDKVVFGAGIMVNDVTAARSGNDLILKVNNPGNPAASDQITIENWDIGDAYRIEQVVFADGTTWNTAQLGNQALTGTDDADTITTWSDGGMVDAKGGNDTITSGNGNATVYAGAGNDTITDSGGNDMIDGGADNDTITDSNGSDTIDGGDGDDVISDGGSGTNVLRGGDGNDVITFSAVANNMIEGGTGNDLLKMDALNGSSLLYANTFAGGTGNDRMESGGSTDTYLFNRGDGQDVISDDDRLYYQKLDKLVFGEGIATTDVTVTRSGNDLMLKINDPGNPGASDEIKIENWDTIWYRIEQVEFVDGTTWSAAQLSEWAMAATDEADTLALWSDGGVVDGKGGNDTINFSSLNTSLAPTTIYGGDGNDSINTYSSGNNSSTFTVDGGAGDDTITDVGEMGIRRTLLGGDGNDVITFSCLGYSGNYAINGGAGNDWIKADGYLTSTGTYRWVNTLTGGAGDDRIESGRSADTYLFNRGDGQDVIRDYNNSSFDTVDKVVFGAGIMVNDVTAARSGNDLILKVNNPGNPAASDQITIENWDIGDAYRIEQVVFADGTVLTKDQVHAMALTVTGTDASDTINGWSENNIVYGMDGNDNITDAGGNDLLNGGMGSDTLDGGAGNDLFIGASGDDLIVTGAGADIIAFNRGDGQDVIAASTGKDNTLSLGHGILYVDLLFQKDNNDLALQTGASEQLIFKDWYASVNNHSVANLQMVIEGTADYEAASANQLNKKKVQQFNFDGLVAKFDSARSADPSLTSWSLSSSLLEFHLNGSSDTAALGGDLAYQYARNGNLSAISASPAQAIMASTQFGTANQNLQSSSALQDLTPRLM